ncbi:Helix-turn-helix domain-containing protein [Georgenia satyanarayanai]|uniref:Helix-turn-helix domain-containing protein n=1 Tax=Georgenia satyanarayanai TaxID=860221 RepID=A0A2Y9A7K2_9MICO|nr:helix-turn-helix domain-containing protein [Georgenia satyanarayanai]PYG00197.1 helix-turn-helix protein [Georgenia satyanarayanai]SSA40441.1 Helix-turn-helix domain-containing protein [Georgenia satyanarayanai]
MSSDLKRFARIVLDRRNTLGLSQVDVWRAGGPSNSTLTKIEGGLPPEPSNATLRKLDVGLQWTPGSARSALSGGDPTPLIQEPRPFRETPRLPADEVQVDYAARWLHERMAELSRSSQTMDDARAIATEMLELQTETELFVKAIERAIELETPREDVEQAIVGAMALYMGSGAYGALSRTDSSAAMRIINRLGELRSVNDQRPNSPSAFAVLTGRINRKEGESGGNTAPRTEAGGAGNDVHTLSRHDQVATLDLSRVARPGTPGNMPDTITGEESQDSGNDDPA